MDKQRVKPRILIVDDKPENLIALRAVLDSSSYEIVERSSGPEALKEIFDGDYALVILDVHMPEMDGFETATLIRARERSKYIPVIFLSAVHIDEKSTAKGYESGGADYITKPFSPEILRRKVEFFVNLGLGIKDQQHQKDISEIYGAFKDVFDKMIDPLWYVLLNIQLLKRLTQGDRRKIVEILNKNLDNLDHAAREVNQLITEYKSKLEEDLPNTVSGDGPLLFD